MDPFTAIGAASAVLSFIEFSWGLVAGAREIYKSAGGTTKDNANISEMVVNLRGLTDNLGTSVLGGSKLETDLKRLTSDCNALSNELMTTLQKLRSSGGIRNAVRARLRSMHKKDDISSIRGRLAEYTSQITLIINTILLNQQSGIKSQLDNMQTVESQSATTTVQRLKDIRESLATSLATALSTQQDISGLRGDIEGERDIISQQTTMLNQIRLSLNSLQDLMRVIPVEKRILKYVFYKSMFHREEAIHDAEEGTFAWLLEEDDDDEDDTSDEESRPGQEEEGDDEDDEDEDDEDEDDEDEDDEDEDEYPRDHDHDESPEEDILASREYLSQSDASTDEEDLWLFEGQREERRLATEKLVAWLQHGSGVFHLSGKAGSGKSTAMKLIIHHESTQKELEYWAGDKHLVTSDHYFWSTGDKMQRSLEGLYRSILFDILRQCPSLIPAVFPEQWAALGSDIQGGPGGQGPIDIEESLFRTSKIKDAFDRLVTEQLDDQYRICLFVDGLDEFQGDPWEHRQLAQSFLRWSQRPNVKCLLSSRPYPEFHQVFPEETRLHLHRLNEHDIYTFSLHMFERDSNLERIRLFYKRLVDDVVQDAEGVFLWAFLVVRILLGSAGYESEEILFRKLRSLPKELGNIYQTLLESLEPVDRERADKMLFLTLCNTDRYLPLSSLAYSWLDMLEDPTFPFANTIPRSIDQLTEHYDLIEQQIASLTKGLLEIGPTQGYIMDTQEVPNLLSKTVRFLHRTVADYLRCSGVLACKSTFNVADAYCRLRIAEIAALEEFDSSDSVIPFYASHMFYQSPGRYYVDPPSYDVLKRMEAEMPVSLPPIFLDFGDGRIAPDRETFKGQTMSVPHFLIFHGLTDYVLSQISSKPRTTSNVPNLNLLLSWVCMSFRGRYAPSDGVRRLLSNGFHFRDKVPLYPNPRISEEHVHGNADFQSGPHIIGTVWMVFVAQLWAPTIMNVMHWKTRGSIWEIDRVHNRLVDLATFMDNGADPDVVISFKIGYPRALPTDGGDQVYYTSLVDTIRALRREAPTIVDFGGVPWDGILSEQPEGSSSRALPSWALKIPGANPQAQMVEVGTLFHGGNHYRATYICSREECIPAGYKVRVC